MNNIWKTAPLRLIFIIKTLRPSAYRLQNAQIWCIRRLKVLLGNKHWCTCCQHQSIISTRCNIVLQEIVAIIDKEKNKANNRKRCKAVSTSMYFLCGGTTQNVEVRGHSQITSRWLKGLECDSGPSRWKRIPNCH